MLGTCFECYSMSVLGKQNFFPKFIAIKKFFINKKELAGNPVGNVNFRQHFPEKYASFRDCFFKLCA